MPCDEATPSPSPKHQGEDRLHSQRFVNPRLERELSQPGGVQLAPVLARDALSRCLVHSATIEQARLQGLPRAVACGVGGGRPKCGFASTRALCVPLMYVKVVRESLGTLTQRGCGRYGKDGSEERGRTRA
jgi:hypothetical protein